MHKQETTETLESASKNGTETLLEVPYKQAHPNKGNTV